MILSVLGLVTSTFLRAKRRHAIVAIAILASFLSPGDVITVMFLLMVPLVVLYELSIFIAVAVERRRDAPGLSTSSPIEGAISFGQ
jgi:sec-independent protein translocase protein TatC